MLRNEEVWWSEVKDVLKFAEIFEDDREQWEHEIAAFFLNKTICAIRDCVKRSDDKSWRVATYDLH